MNDNPPVSEIQLHAVSDSSEAAYRAVSYLRFSFKAGEHSTAFVMSKSRVAPTTAVTLSRLELNTALTGVPLYRLLICELDI